MRRYSHRNRPFYFSILFIFLLVLPNLFYIVLDKTYWGSDEATYGNNSIVLIEKLVHAPNLWFSAMINNYPQKAPMLFWLGQFFAPFGYAFGSVDVALRFMLFLAQIIVMVLFFKLLEKLFNNRFISVIGCLIVSAAPLYIRYSTIYMVELLQVLTVIWFIYIVVYCSQWDSLRIIMHSVAAFAFGQLVKTSTMMYTAMPLLYITLYLFKTRFSDLKWDRRRHIKLAFFTILLIISTLIYYITNFKLLLQLVTDASKSPMWGSKAPFLQKLIVWWSILQTRFFEPYVVYLFLGLLIIAIILYKHKKQIDLPPGIIALGAILQIAIVLTINSLATSTVERYILAVLPYVAILICWSLAVVNKRLLNILFFAVCSFQLISVNLIRFDLIQKVPAFARNYQRVDIIGKQRESAIKIYSYLSPYLCNGETVCAIRLGEVKIDKRLNYYLRSTGRLPCEFDTNLPLWPIMPYYIVRLERKTLKETADNYWENIRQKKPKYYLTPTREVLLRDTNWYWVLPNEFALKLIDLVEASGLYEEQSLSGSGIEDYGFAIYRLQEHDRFEPSPKIVDLNINLAVDNTQIKQKIAVLRQFSTRAKRYSEAIDLANYLLSEKRYADKLADSDKRDIFRYMFYLNKDVFKNTKKALENLDSLALLGGKYKKEADSLRSNYHEDN